MSALCSVCRRNLLLDEVIIDALACGHVFHRECITNIRNNLCPNCRQQFNRNNNTRLYITYGEEYMDEMGPDIRIRNYLQNSFTNDDQYLNQNLDQNRGRQLRQPPPTDLRYSHHEYHNNHVIYMIPIPFPYEQNRMLRIIVHQYYLSLERYHSPSNSNGNRQ